MAKTLKEIKKKKTHKHSHFGTDGNDIIHGGKNNDYIYGGNGNDKLYGGNGNDILYGNGGNDTIYGGKGNDKLYGGNGNDKFAGGKGDDVIYTGSGKNTVYVHKGDGHDTIYHQGEKTSIALDNFREFDSDVSFTKENKDLNIIYSYTDKTKEIITIKDYFTSDGKTVSKGIYVKTEPVMVLPMYAVPEFPVQEYVWEQECLKYAPPQYMNTENPELQTEIQDFLVVAKYGIPPIDVIPQNPEYDFTEESSPTMGDDSSAGQDATQIIDMPVLKYAPPVIYGYTRREVELSTLLDLNGLTINAKKPGKYYGSEFDDTIKGSKGADTIIAGDGNDKIYSGKGNNKINAGKGINILYFSKNDGKNTVFNGGGTDILIVKNDKFSNLKARFSRNDAILKYTGGEIILKDYKNGNHSAKYIQFGNKRKAIEDLLPAFKKTETTNSDSSFNLADTSLIQSDVSEWSATDVSAPESVYASEQTPDNINVVLGIDNLNK